MSAKNLLSIRTPEGIVFSQVLAGPVTRALARVLDFLCVLVAIIFLDEIVRVFDLFSEDLGSAVVVIGYFVLSIGYSILCEWRWRGQTIGKRLLNLRVVDVEGLRLQFHQVVTRNLLRFVDALPLAYLLGGVVCWLSPKSQRLGDIAANTVVIRPPRVTEPDLNQLLAGKFNSLRLHPHLAARLRQLVTPAEAAIALQAVMRRDEFEPVARVQLFAELARHFSAKVEFPAEATEGMADEQFIRNVVDVVYRPRVDPAPARVGADTNHD